MYFSRFKDNLLTLALSQEIITDSEYVKIREFWYKNIMYNVDVDLLDKLNITYKILSSNQVEILKWPFLKDIFLKVCKLFPTVWLYQDEEENSLFGYVIGEECKIITKEDIKILENNPRELI